MAMPDSSRNRSGSEDSQVSLRQRPNGDGAANGSSTLVHSILVGPSGQGGWRLEDRGRSLQGIEMFDNDRKYPVCVGGSTLSSLSTFKPMRIPKHHEV